MYCSSERRKRPVDDIDCFFITDRLDLEMLVKPKCMEVDNFKSFLINHAQLNHKSLVDKLKDLLSYLYFYDDYICNHNIHKAVVVGKYASQLAGVVEKSEIIEILIFQDRCGGEHLSNFIDTYGNEYTFVRTQSRYFRRILTQLKFGLLLFKVVQVEYEFISSYCTCDLHFYKYFSNEYKLSYKYKLIVRKKYCRDRLKYVDMVLPVYIFNNLIDSPYIRASSKNPTSPPSLFQYCLRFVVMNGITFNNNYMLQIEKNELKYQ